MSWYWLRACREQWRAALARQGLDRALALGVAALLVGAAIFVGTRSFASPERASAASAPALREFTLVAQEVDWEIEPGTVVKAWTYGGTMPGPELRVTEGDLVRVRLQNNLPVPTSIHWHGVDVPNNMDGVPGITQDAVQPEGSFTYEFVATNPGTRWYHSHQDGETQISMGMFGPLIIEPRTPPAGAVSYNRDYTYVLSERSFALTPEVAEGEASIPPSGPGSVHSKEWDFDVFMMNGKAHDAIPPIEVKRGEKVRIRLINAGQLVHTIHSHGHSFKVIATDGNFIPPQNQLLKDSVTLGPSERVDIELDANNPGVWMFHCHMQHHAANGMMTTIRYEGVDPPVGSSTMALHTAGAPAAPAPGPGPADSQGASLQPASAPLPVGNQVQIAAVDNRFQPSNVTVPVGATVTWTNKGVNVHDIAGPNNLFVEPTFLAGETFSYTFNQPGSYLYICRKHALVGMVGTVVVQ